MEIQRLTREQHLAQVEQEFARSEEERRRIADFAFADELTMEKNWSEIAISTKKLLMADFQDRQVSFQEMLEVMRKCSLGLPAPARLFYLGTLAEFGLKNPSPKKESSRGKTDFPPHARWFRRMTVDLVDMIKSCHPDTKYFPGKPGKDSDDQSILDIAARFLSGMHLCLPAPKTVQAWMDDPEHRRLQPFRYTGQRGSVET